MLPKEPALSSGHRSEFTQACPEFFAGTVPSFFRGLSRVFFGVTLTGELEFCFVSYCFIISYRGFYKMSFALFAPVPLHLRGTRSSFRFLNPAVVLRGCGICRVMNNYLSPEFLISKIIFFSILFNLGISILHT